MTTTANLLGLPDPEPTQDIKDISSIVPESGPVRLSSGTYVEVHPLRTRQLFKLMKIITRGAGPLFLEMDLNFSDSEEAFVGKLLGLVIIAVPEAENEAIEFLQAMTDPVGTIEGRRLTPADQERNDTLWAAYNAALENPELEDTLDLIEVIIRRSASDIQSLGKRLRTMLPLAQATAART